MFLPCAVPASDRCLLWSVPDTRLQMSRTGSCESGIQGVVQDGSARMEEQRGKVLSSTFVIEDWVPAKNCGEARGDTAGEDSKRLERANQT